MYYTKADITSFSIFVVRVYHDVVVQVRLLGRPVLLPRPVGRRRICRESTQVRTISRHCSKDLQDFNWLVCNERESKGPTSGRTTPTTRELCSHKQRLRWEEELA